MKDTKAIELVKGLTKQPEDTALITFSKGGSVTRIEALTADTIGEIITQLMEDETTEQVLETGFLMGFHKLDDIKKDMLLCSILLVAYMCGKAGCIPDMLDSIEEYLEDIQE